MNQLPVGGVQPVAAFVKGKGLSEEEKARPRLFVLVVDLDHTLIHTTSEKKCPPSREEISHHRGPDEGDVFRIDIA